MKIYLPILFTGLMVQANFDKRKNQTRRLSGLDYVNKNPDDWVFSHLDINQRGKLVAIFRNVHTPEHIRVAKCPYGQPGDVLWVRETWAKNYDGTFDYKAGYPFTSPQGGWKPNIHMPKVACRMFLKNKGVRLERLQDISNMDAMNEGIECLDHGLHWKNYLSDEISCFINPKHSFESLWKSINGPESWNENPWVWVIEFERIEKPTNWISL